VGSKHWLFVFAIQKNQYLKGKRKVIYEIRPSVGGVYEGYSLAACDPAYCGKTIDASLHLNVLWR
jgi:hypothetical protein